MFWFISGEAEWVEGKCGPVAASVCCRAVWVLFRSDANHQSSLK